METKEKEKMGIMIIDGEIVDLDKSSLEELEKHLEKLEKQEKEIQRRINKILGINM